MLYLDLQTSKVPKHNDVLATTKRILSIVLGTLEVQAPLFSTPLATTSAGVSILSCGIRAHMRHRVGLVSFWPWGFTECMLFDRGQYQYVARASNNIIQAPQHSGSEFGRLCCPRIASVFAHRQQTASSISDGVLYDTAELGQLQGALYIIYHQIPYALHHPRIRCPSNP